MFVRVKKVGTYRYLQIAENRREGKRVKQTIIATLGRLDKLTASGAFDQLLRSAARFIEPTACWNSVSGPFKPPGPITLNASFEGSHNPTPFPKRSGSTHPRQPQQEKLLSKSLSPLSQSR